jgi:hypothetical protein
MFTFEMKVGRLVETRIVGALGMEELRDLFSAMLTLVPRLPPDGKVLSLTDLRAARAMPVDAAEHMVLMLKGSSSRLEREAILLGTDRVAAMQMARMEKETAFPGRRICRDENEALEWLRPLATPAELTRARKFLTDGRPK